MSTETFTIELTVEFRNALRPQLGVVSEAAEVTVVADSREAAIAAAPEAFVAEWARHFPHIEIIEIELA